MDAALRPRKWNDVCAGDSNRPPTVGGRTSPTSGSRASGANLYRAVDSSGATLDFLLSAERDAAAAKRFLAKALGRQNHPVPRIINSDGHAAYPPARRAGTCSNRTIARSSDRVNIPIVLGSLAHHRRHLQREVERLNAIPKSLACRKRISAHCSRFFVSCCWSMK